MKKALLGVTAAATLVVLAWVGASAILASGSSAPTGWSPTPGLALREPLQIRPNAKGVVNVKLVATTEKIAVSGTTLQATPFNGELQGPTIHVRPKGRIQVRLVNKMTPGTSNGSIADPTTNIHYHGMHVSPLGIGDNVFRTFPGQSENVSIVDVPANQEPGTFWYHVHFHGNSDQQIMGGLSGLLVVDGLTSLLPRNLRGVPQRQLALRTVQVDDNVILGEQSITPGLPTATRLVNTLYQPKFKIASRRYELWRLANIGSDDFFKVSFQSHLFAVIAEDGSPVWKVTRHKELLMPPGKRFDVLVRGGKPGTYSSCRASPTPRAPS